MTSNACPCCGQTVARGRPINYSSSGRDRTYQWAQAAVLSLEPGEHFNLQQIVERIERVVNVDDLEEVAVATLKEHLREHLLKMEEVDVVRHGKPGRHYVYRRRPC